MHTVCYSSSRLEVWKWYWHAWAKPGGLWRYHAFVAVLLAVLYTQPRSLADFRVSSFLLTATVAMLGCMCLFSLWPQVRFKRNERTLSVDSTGWSTQIGTLKGSRTWSEVSHIIEKDGTICIVGTNKNALLVPPRAFDSEDARHRFLGDIRAWHRLAAGKPGAL